MTSNLWPLFSGTLQLHETTFDLIKTRSGFQACLALFALAVLSKSLGEAGILYINRATKGQYLRGLLGSLAVLFFTALVWTGCIWLSCRYALGLTPDYRQVFAIVLVSYVPLIFSFLDIIPHLGLVVFKLLTIWGLLITITGLHREFGLTIGQGLACSAVGWVLFYVLNSAFGGAAEKVRLRLLGRDRWVNPKEAAVALLERELRR
ncbi:MAG TPA: YIP1 family protein [Phycisphaerales bacterium]|nr:YIP1 family protein [Phycisphaerales bacterium]